MAATGAIPSKGAVLSIWQDGVGQYEPIAEVTSISVEGSRIMATATHLNSDNGAEEYVGCEHGTVVSFELNLRLDSDTQNDNDNGLMGQFADGWLKRSYQLVLPDSGDETFTFDANVESFPYSAQHGDILRGSVALRVTNVVTVS